MNHCRTVAACTLTVAALVCLAGCNSRLRKETSFRLEPGRDYTLQIDAPRYEQNVGIEVSATEPVKIQVAFVDNGKSSVQAMKSDTKTFNREIRVPAGQRFTINVASSSSKTTEVSLKAQGTD